LNPCNLISCVTETCSQKKFIVFWWICWPIAA
jgi:hypothetical protein